MKQNNRRLRSEEANLGTVESCAMTCTDKICKCVDEGED